jgi:hypothetical protein
VRQKRDLPHVWATRGLAEEDCLLTTRETARLLAISPNTLKYWRVRAHRAGPDFIRIERRVRYSLKHLRRYLGDRTVRIGKCSQVGRSK